jgi:hypothetical protein
VGSALTGADIYPWVRRRERRREANHLAHHLPPRLMIGDLSLIAERRNAESVLVVASLEGYIETQADRQSWN